MNKESKNKAVLNFETASISRNDLANFLLTTATKVNLVNRKMKNFSSSTQFSVIYNKEELTEILHITIAKVVNAHEAYILKKKGLSVPDNYPKIGADLDLSSFGNIVGYMRTAYDNNISKDYKKHIATKRAGYVISYDSASQTENEDSKQGNAIFNLIFEDSIAMIDSQKEYNRLIREIFGFLRKYDKKMNHVFSKKAKIISEEKRSKLSYLFLYLLNPKLKGKFLNIKEKQPLWSQYIFNKNKDSLSEIIQKQFPESMDFLYNYLNNFYDSAGENQAPKQSKFKNDLSCDTSSCFSFKYNKDSTVEVSYTLELFKIVGGKREILKNVVKKSTVIATEIDSAKSTLINEMQGSLIELKNEANQIRTNAQREINS